MHTQVSERAAIARITTATLILIALAAGANALTPGLISSWNADGNARDSNDGNHGTLTGGTYTAGKLGQAFNLDGGGYVIIPNGPNQQPAQFTAAAWIKLNRDVGATQACIFCKIPDDPAQVYPTGYGLEIQGAGYYGSTGNLLTFNIGKGGSVGGVAYTLMRSTTPVTPNQWTHIAGTYDGATMKIYINGNLEASAAHPYGNPAAAWPLYIGARQPGQFIFPGVIDEVALYDRALTQQEIRDLITFANQPPANQTPNCTPTIPPAPTTGLVSRWSAEGNTNDATGANNGAPEGSVSYAPGIKGQAFNLNGAGWINAGTGSTLALTSFTIAAWARTTGTAAQMIVNRAPGGIGAMTNYQTFVSEGIPILSSTDGGSGYAGASGPTKINDGQFHHIVGTYDAARRTASIYVDGKLQGTGIATGGDPYTGGSSYGPSIFKIGTADGYGTAGIQSIHQFIGQLDEVAVYNRALSTEEVQALCESEAPGKCNLQASCPQPTTETCTDGITNQGETSVDCGGPCPPCPFTAQEAPDPRANQTNATTCIPVVGN